MCFIVDTYSRMIVGWRVASHMRTTMVLDALEMARWSRGNTLPGLTCHSDAGCQFTSIRYGERLAEIGAVPSIGTIGDSFGNALAETVNGYYKAELIYGPARSGPWKTVEDIELATLGWVYRHNTSRLHSYLADVPPTEFEAAFYDAQRTDQPLKESHNPSLRQNQGASTWRAAVVENVAPRRFGHPRRKGGHRPLRAREKQPAYRSATSAGPRSFVGASRQVPEAYLCRRAAAASR